MVLWPLIGLGYYECAADFTSPGNHTGNEKSYPTDNSFPLFPECVWKARVDPAV